MSQCFVIDLDISKKSILEFGDKPLLFDTLLSQAKTLAFNIKQQLEAANINSFIEFSGYKGYHVWIVYEKPQHIPDTWEIIQRILRPVFRPSPINIEYIPSLEINSEELMKIPYSYHETTLHQSVFIDENGAPVSDLVKAIGYIKVNPSIDKFALDPQENFLNSDALADKIESSGNDEIFCENEVSDTLSGVIRGCPLIARLIEKAVSEHYLTHYERNALLYVFGHIKETGIPFLHKTFSNLINYNQDITQGFIDRLQSKPVSCEKLKLRFPHLSELCSCKFTTNPHCYPSPVLHALAVKDGSATIPDYIDLAMARDSLIALDDANQLDRLTEKMLVLSRQKNQTESEIHILSETLTDMFSKNKTSECSTPYGRLMLRNGEWLIKVM
jgi:hypothetical protein